MQVLFEARGAEALALRGVAVRRTRFVLRRLQWLAPRARVHLEDINGPRGGVDKRCCIELQRPAGEPLVVSALASQWREALDAALARAARALLRWWQRHRGQPATARLVPPR